MTNTDKTARKHPWRRNTPEGRWYGFGRYLAMFPPNFTYDAISALSHEEEAVLDPFCGRGNAPFTAAALNRPTIGIDINPVAWIFAATKVRPAQSLESVIARLSEIARARRPADAKARNQFETMAWNSNTRALLRAARRELDWKESAVDRTLMGFIAHHIQDKLGGGLSNSMSPTIAYSPEYAVKWWTKQKLTVPPDISPVVLLADKIRRRYEHGAPKLAKSEIILGDARNELSNQPNANAGLIMTSPPYSGVTDYWNDHWIRLWLLGYEFRKDWRKTAKYANKSAYQNLLHKVFAQTSKHLKKNGAVLVRSDRRHQTAVMCITAITRTWPDRKIYIRETTAPHPSISAHHGRGGKKAKEIDLLIPGNRGKDWLTYEGFKPLNETEWSQISINHVATPSQAAGKA